MSYNVLTAMQATLTCSVDVHAGQNLSTKKEKAEYWYLVDSRTSAGVDSG